MKKTYKEKLLNKLDKKIKEFTDLKKLIEAGEESKDALRAKRMQELINYPNTKENYSKVYRKEDETKEDKDQLYDVDSGKKVKNCVSDKIKEGKLLFTNIDEIKNSWKENMKSPEFKEKLYEKVKPLHKVEDELIEKLGSDTLVPVPETYEHIKANTLTQELNNDIIEDVTNLKTFNKEEDKIPVKELLKENISKKQILMDMLTGDNSKDIILKASFRNSQV